MADTWNHRIQKFDASGRFLKRWGGLADAKGGADAEPGTFWGPRDVAIGPDGLLYVTDTGNKRIQVFDTERQLCPRLRWRGYRARAFPRAGRLRDRRPTILVADTWNKRVQRLDLNGRPLAQYPIPEWERQSISNKPYLASFGDGRIRRERARSWAAGRAWPGRAAGQRVQPDGEGTTGGGPQPVPGRAGRPGLRGGQQEWAGLPPDSAALISPSPYCEV